MTATGIRTSEQESVYNWMIRQVALHRGNTEEVILSARYANGGGWDMPDTATLNRLSDREFEEVADVVRQRFRGPVVHLVVNQVIRDHVLFGRNVDAAILAICNDTSLRLNDADRALAARLALEMAFYIKNTNSR